VRRTLDSKTQPILSRWRRVIGLVQPATAGRVLVGANWGRSRFPTGSTASTAVPALISRFTSTHTGVVITNFPKQTVEMCTETFWRTDISSIGEGCRHGPLPIHVNAFFGRHRRIAAIWRGAFSRPAAARSWFPSGRQGIPANSATSPPKKTTLREFVSARQRRPHATRGVCRGPKYHSCRELRCRSH